MEVDGGTVTAVSAVVMPVAYALGRAIYKDRQDIVEQLKDCTKQHAADQYVAGSMNSAIRFLSSKHSPETQRIVDEMLSDGEAKAEEVKSTIPPKESKRLK